MDLRGLRPLDVSGLTKADQDDTSFDLGGLRPLDTTGLTALDGGTSAAVSQPERQPDFHPEPQPERRGLFSRIGSGFSEGYDLGAAGISITGEVLTGADNDDLAQMIARQNLRESHVSPEVQAIQERVSQAGAPYQGAWGEGEYLRSLKGVFVSLAATGREFINDPVSYAEFSAQAIGTSAVPIGAMIVGAIGGSVVPGVGSVGGSIVGGFAGSSTLEFGLWMQEAVTDKVVEAGLDPTDPVAISQILQNPEVKAEIMKEAATKGLTHAAVGAVIDRLSAGLLRYKPKTRTGKVVQKGGAGTVQIASEGLEEGISQIAATGDYDVADVALEMAGGLGAGVSQTIILDLAKGGSAVVQGAVRRPDDPDAPDIPEGAVSADTLYGRVDDGPAGIRQSARADAPILSEDDINSSLDTRSIHDGRQIMQDAVARQQANDMLRQAGMPEIESRVTLTARDGSQVSGMVIDAFDTQGLRGIKIRLDNGVVVSETFDQLRGRIAEEVVLQAPGEATASVPTMITQGMRRQLGDLGYSPDDIRSLRPQEAWDIINSGQRKAVDVRTEDAATGASTETRIESTDQGAAIDLADRIAETQRQAAEERARIRGEQPLETQTDDLPLRDGRPAGPEASEALAPDRPGDGTTPAQDPAQPGLDTLPPDTSGSESVPGADQPGTADPALTDLPEGWTEATPGGLATSKDPETGGIVDRRISDGTWFAVPARDGAETIEGLASRSDAIAALAGNDEAAQPEATRQPIRRAAVENDADTAITASGREVPVRYAVVEADDLVASQTDDGRVNQDYPAELQPRDRSRSISQQQIQDIATKLNPRLLDRSPRASDGAPIISEEGVVESGNGRTLALRRAYDQSLPGAQAYRDYLAAQGYPVEGMSRPVLVRIREGEMQPADRQAFTREANERDTLGMSATERAMADAAAMNPGMLELYRGGDIDSAANRPFVRAFIDAVVGLNEQAGMIAADGSMSQEAIRRIEGALLARAYGDADLVARLIESADNNIRAIGGALLDVAPRWAQMREEARSGAIDPSVDQTERLLEAVRLVQRARRERRSVAEFVGQRDMLSGDALHPVSEAFLRLMFRNTQGWTQPAGRDPIAEALTYYIDEAERTQPGPDLLGDSAPSPERILAAAKERQYADEQQAAQQQDLLAQPAGSTRERDGEVGRERAEQDPEDPAQPRGEETERAGEEGARPLIDDQQRRRAENLRDFAQGANLPGVRASMEALLAGHDPTGGQVSVDVQLDAAERSLAAPDNDAEPSRPALSPALRIEDYTDKSIIVRGETRDNIDRIKAAIPGRRPLWNRRAQGWVFPKAREEEVRAALSDLLEAPATAAGAVDLGDVSIGDVLTSRTGELYRIESIDPDTGRVRTTRNPDQLSERVVLMGQDRFDRLVREDADERVAPESAQSVELTASEARESRRIERQKRSAMARGDGDTVDSLDEQQEALRDRINQRIQGQGEPAAAPSGTPAQQPEGERRIGANARGNPLFEDERGVRSYTEGGIRITETVGIIPGGGISIDEDARGNDFLTEEERAARAPAARAPAAPVRAEAPGTRTNGESERSAADKLESILGMNVSRSAPEGAAVGAIRSVIEELRKPRTASSVESMLETAAQLLDRNFSAQADIVRDVVDELRLGAAGVPQAPAHQAAPAYGQSNKVFTQDAAERAREILRSKLNQLNAGLDPEIVQAGITLAGYHIEAGARSFADYARAMIADLGESARPYLRSWYEGVRYYPGFNAEGMSTAAEIETEASQDVTLDTEEVTDDGVQRPVPGSDARASAEDVQPPAPDRGDGGAPAEEGRRSQADVRRADGERAEAAERPAGAAVPEGGRTGRAGDSDRVPAGRQQRAERPAQSAERLKGDNYLIEPGALEESRGRTQKARDNIRAIELMRQIEAEGRPATRAEQEQLARYVGWGGLKGAFPDTQGKFEKGFEAIGKQLQELLTEAEYNTARRSLQYAHYTAENVARAMWDAAQRLGFTGGKVFEPGMGIGNFPGLMPGDLAARTDYNGLELDHTTARMARLIYPRWGVRQDDFTKAPLPKDTFDLVIGNPPFADIPIKSDPAYPQGFLLHDYFFAKSLDAVRPGGILAFISSAGTMNKMDTSAREYMADRADLVGAIRLPGSAFEQSAGTSVTTDIVFLRKRLPGETAADRSWTETTTVTLPNKEGVPTKGRVSRYFVDNPEMVLGEEGFFDPLYEGRYGVRAPKGFDLDAALRQALGRLPESVMTPWQDTGERAEVDFGTAERKEGSFYLGRDGQIMQQRDGVGRPVERRGKGVQGGRTLAEMERIKALVPIRDALRSVYAADLADDAANAETARRRLNESYDAFVKRFGPINQANFQYRRPTIIQQESARMAAREEARYAGEAWREGSFDASSMIEDGASLQQIARARADAREAAQKAGREFDEGSFDPTEMPDLVIEKRPNIDPFMDDPESYRLRAIEDYDDQSGEAKKTEVFYRNIITREREPEINSVNDALLWTLNQRGRLDLPEVARLAGISESEAIEQLGENIYRLPNTDNQWVTKESYLSGDVRRKLREARLAAERDPELQRNVDALEAAQPAPLPPSEIDANLGMPWVPTGVIESFGTDGLGLERLSVTYTPALGEWRVSGDENSVAARTTWGTADRAAPALLQDALNRQTPRIYRESWDDGKKVRVLDAEATQMAQDKLRDIRIRFSEWVWSDPVRANDLAERYNEEYNNLVVREHDGSYLTTPGISSAWSWRPHQKRVIARIIQDGNTYMAHGVGAGKTSAMIGAGMEMRRLGLVRKPMYAVPNHMLGQFTKEFYEQYPTARIAVADERQFHTSRRKQFVANVANEDLDAVIITHSAFGMIPISDEFQDSLIQEQIDQYRDLLQEVGKDQESRITRSRLEKQIERLEQRLAGRGTRRRDQVFTFEEMGVDFLFVDEAHLFRKLDFATKMSNVKGISPEGSKASWDLYVKTRYLETINPGRNLVLASGTPVTNTMAELYTVSRYLQPQELKSRGLEHFDAWAGAFGDTSSGLEQDPSGNYSMVTRFNKFVNVPELSNMVRQVMDVVTSRQLEEYVTRPKLKGGQRQMNLAQRSPALEEYQTILSNRMDAIAARRGPPEPGDDIILSVINDGRHAAIDMRLVDPDLPNDPGSKLNLMVDNVFRIWKDTKRQPFHGVKREGGYTAKAEDTGPAAQMIFANLGLSGTRGFSVPDYIRAELQRRGVPKSEIAYISDYKTHVARQRLFNDMNEGKVRILIGSTAKMATGVNAQRRLYAVHNLDPLWFPADDEQRNGRIIRQGNMNPEIEIHDYSTKGTYDSTMWDMMAKKAKFIQDFFEGDPNLRSMEDLGEASQYEQAKAMTSSDPRLMELTNLRQDLERAMRRKSGFEREQYAIQRRVTEARDRGRYYESRVAATEADIARRQDVSGDKFRATFDGRTYTDRVEFGDRILAQLDIFMGESREIKGQKVGEIGGFDILAEVWGQPGNRQSTLLIAREGGFETEVRVSGSSRGLVQSLEATLRGMEGDLEDSRTRLADAQKTVRDFEPQVGREFTGQAEIDRLTKQVRDLENELAAEARPEPRPEGDTEGQFSLREDQTNTPEFRRWFGDSKVVDEQGRPLVVYHGTASDFDLFDPGEVGSHFGYDEVGFFFTDDRSDIPGGAGDFAARAARNMTDEGDGANILPVYLSLQNPYTLDLYAADFNTDVESMVMYGGEQQALVDVFDQDRDEIMRRVVEGGYDGLDFRFGGDSLFVALRPEQIKSAIGNQGTFDPANPDIRFAIRDEFARDAEAVTTDLSARLKQLGIADKVALSLRDRIQAAAGGTLSEADGRYLNRTIEVSLTAPDSMGTLNHEVIHALRDMGLIRDAEWRALERGARADTERMAAIGERYSRLGLPDSAVVEEVIADMHKDWAAGNTQARGFVRRAFERIRDFLQALGRVLTGRGYHTADSVFRAIDRGDVGRRQPRDARGRFVRANVPSRQDQTDTPAFKRWFGDSKVVDEQGRPLVVYHGTGASFDTFVTEEGAERYYFVKDPGVASEYAGGQSAVDLGFSTPNVMPVYVSLQNPLMFDAGGKQWSQLPLDLLPDDIRSRVAGGSQTTVNLRDVTHAAQSAGYDGVVARNMVDPAGSYGDNNPTDVFIAFRDTQIKSAIGNRGTFDPDNPDIRYAVRDPGPRFALRNERANDPTSEGGAQARQRGMNQWLGSQPVDHAFRLPFQLFGGINDHGEWAWGKALSSKTADIITNAKFDDAGRFSWINPSLEKARAGLLDRYGLDPAYVERERQRGLQERRIMADAQGVIESLREAGVGTEEAKVLQAVLTGEAVSDADMARLAEPIRDAIDDMGAEAVELGLISAESFERNRGAYLHRVYLKHEADQGSLVRWASRMAQGRRRKIIGNQFKGRGMWIEVKPDSLMRNIPGFREAERGAPTQGERFRVLDLVDGGTTETLRDIDPATQRRTLDRVYLPEDAPIPEGLRGYEDRGVWEVRGKQGGNTVLWRDFTRQERASMGEIVDARYTIAKTYMQMAHDLSTGRFFQDIALNGDWSRTDEPRPETWRNASDYNRFWADPEVEWVKVPDTNIPKSRTKRYGALAGKYVRAEIWRDLAELDKMNKAGFWNTLLTQWKLNKTARNPVVHMNNIMSNVVLMDLADVRVTDLVGAVASMAGNTAEYREAVDNGAFGSDMVAQEIRRNILQPLLEEIQRDAMGGRDTVEAKFGTVGKLADAIWSKAKSLDRKMVGLYQLEDEVFRMATYLRKRSYGVAPAEAALQARDQFLNYDIRAPWVNAARRSVLPFLSYTYRAVPVVAESVALRPWKLAKYATMAYAANALAYMLSGGDEGEERRSMRDQDQGSTWIGAPRMIRMPWSDPYGNPVFLDVRRWIPAGDVFDMNQGHSAIPIPAPLQFGGPLMLASELMLNKQAFTGQEIINDRTDDWWDKTSKVGDWAWKSWMPSAAWIPGSWYWERIGNAITGATDRQGRPYTLRTAIPSSLGIKLNPQDVQENFFWKGIEFNRIEQELRGEMRAIYQRYERGMMSRQTMEKQQQKVLKKLENLNRERQRTFVGEE